MVHAILLITAYLLGSIPFGWLLAKWSGKGDLRNVGSGGTGATNAMRVGGLKMALLVWMLDMAKGFIAALLGMLVFGESFGALCGFVAIVGHCFPVWLKFKGGKGVSSMFGAMMAISPLSFIICGIEWLLIAFTTGYSSLGAIISFIIMPLLGFAISVNMGLVFTAISLLCLYQHRENIVRLIKGEESTIKWKWKK